MESALERLKAAREAEKKKSQTSVTAESAEARLQAAREKVRQEEAAAQKRQTIVTAQRKNMTSGAPTASELEKPVLSGSFGGGRTTTKLGGFTGQRESPSQQKESQADWGKIVKGAVLQGADQAAKGITSTAAMLEGTVTKPMGKILGNEELYKDGLFYTLNEIIGKAAESNQERFQPEYEKGGKVGEAVGKYGAATVAAVPQAIMAFMTAGRSLAAQGTTAGLQAASAAAKGTGIAQTVTTAMQSLAKNPQYLYSVASTMGNEYEQAKADGASDLQAYSYAALTGLLNAQVEVGGGIDVLPDGTKGVLRQWIGTMLDEGKEEVIQGAISQLAQNAVYGKGNALAGLTDENAIISGKRASEEFLGGAIVGGILGGGQMGLQSALNRVANVQGRRTAQEAPKSVLSTEGTATPPAAQNASERAVGQAKGQNETAAQDAAVDAEKYPNLYRQMRGETGVDPDAVATETMDAVADGTISQEKGRDLVRQAVAAARSAPQTSSAVEQVTRAAEQKAPGFYDDTGTVDQNTSRYMQKLATASRSAIRMVASDTVKGTNGMYVNGEILINREAEDPLRFVAQHEVTHRLQETAAEEYGRLSEYVRGIYEERGSLGESIRARQELYREVGQELTEEQAVDELVADYVGELMVDEAAIDRIIRQDRNLAQRIWDAVKNWFDRVRSSLGGEDARQARRALELWETAMRRTYESDTSLEDGSEAKYSISRTKDGRRFVEVEEDILAGIPENKWLQTVRDNLKTKFPSGVTVGNNQIRIDKTSRKEMTYSGYMRWLRYVDPNLFADKLRATNNADEVLQSATGWISEGLHHQRTDDIADFARGKVLLRIGSNDYEADVIVGTKTDGIIRMYDIINLTPTAFTKKETGTAITANPSPGTGSNTAPVSYSGDAQVTDVQAPVRTSDNEPASTPKTRVAQEDGNGKEKNSVKGARDLQKQIDRLERQNKRLREQMKLTNVPKANRKAVEKQAGELRKAYSSRIDKTELADRMEKLYAGMAALSGNDSLWEGGSVPSWEEVRAEARSIADDILAESRDNINPMYGELADLRRDLRSRKISLSQEYRADLESVGGYNELRKRSMGSFTLSNDGTPVDMVYQELSDQYPDLFPDDIIHPADQLVRISEVAQDLKAVEGNPFERELEYTAAYLAGEIEERFYDTPQEKPTVADKMARKYHEQRLKDQRLNADKLYNQQKAHEREIRSMEERYREENRKRIENQSASQRRETIRRHAERLGRKLVRPTDKQHVPDEMRGAALALVRYINTESNYYVNPETKKRVYFRDDPQIGMNGFEQDHTSRTAAARELQAEYGRLAQDTTLTIDPDMGDYLDEIARMGNKPLGDMTRAELDTVWKVLQVIEHTISKSDDLLAESRYRTVSDMANALREENGGRKDRGDWAGALGMADKLLNADMLTPETYFSRLGDAGADIFRQMRRAADRQTTILKEGTDQARKLIEKSGVSFKKADKELHTFEVSGGEITLSKSQIMELYALSKREQAMEHIYVGGLKPRDAVKVLKKVGGSKSVKVTPNDVAEMVSTLSDKEKSLVDGLQKYLSGDLARHGNEESRKVYGYDKFKERNYWPIKVSSSEVASDPTKAAGAKTIPGYGMTKALTPKANNAVELRSAIDTFSNHLNQMATYAAWLGTNENVTRLHNFKYQTEDGQRDGTVKEIFEKVYGKSGSKYLENLLGDIAQGTKAGADKSLAEQGLSKFKAAKVGGNLRVIIQQPTAILRAMEMVDPKYFVSAKNPLNGWKKAKEYSGIAQWKDWGYFEMDTGRSLRELMTGTESEIDKWKNRLMVPAGAADSVAWGHLWNAVEAETEDKHPELEKGSRGFYEAAAERFSEVVDRTQVVDSVLHRTQIMRSSSYANKMLTSFMSEPSKVYNMVVRDLYALGSADSDAARKKAGNQLGRTTAALIISFAVNSLAQSLVDGLRDDDRDKGYWDKVADNWSENFAQNFNPLGYIPWLKDIDSLRQGYTLERSDMEGIADAIKAMQQFIKATKGESQKTVLSAGLEAASKLGDMMGLPVSNLRRDAGAIFHTVMNGIGAGKQLYEWDKLKYNPETAMSIFQNDLYRAMDTDWATYEMIYGDILAELQEQGMTEDEAKAKIKNAMESRMKKSLGVDSVSSLPIRYSAPGESQEFDTFVKAAIQKNTNWEEELPGDVVELAQELEEQNPEKTARVLMIAGAGMDQSWAESFLRQTLSDSEMERYTACRKSGVTMQEWAEAYSAIGGAVYQRTKKRGTATQADVETALNKMKGLSNSKKTAIWNSYGWKKESPWG